MKNSRASALAIALSMMVLLTGLGLGALNYSGAQGVFFFNQKLSTQAFWLADAGLQQSAMAKGAAEPLTNLGDGTYEVGTSTSGSTVTLTSTGTVNGGISAKRKLQAIGSIVPLFNNAVISGTSSTSGVNVGSGVTVENYNSNGSAATGTGEIETTNITGSPSVGGVTSNAGLIFPPIPLPSTFQPCPGGTDTSTPWHVTANKIISGAGSTLYYQCPYLTVDPGTTLYITTPVVLYLTATDPATGPDPINGEDLRGDDFQSNNSPYTLGYIKILSGGSLTIYAAGRITTGSGYVIGNGYATTETLNNASFVDFLNQDLWDPNTTYSINTYVTYNNEAWQSQSNNNLNQTPSASSSYWSLITYSPTMTYPVNAYVTYNGGAWRSTVGANLGNTPGSSSSDWILSNNPIPADLIIYSLYTSPSAWSPTTAYAAGDVVAYGGSAWQSIQAGTGQPPDISPLYWENLAWNPATNYSVGKLAYYNGLLWQSIIAGTDQQPIPYSSDAPNAFYAWNTYAGVEINNNTDHFYGLIYSPQSLVWLNLQEVFSGSVVGNMVNVQSGTTVNYDQSLTANANLPTTFNLTSWKECSSTAPANGC